MRRLLGIGILTAVCVSWLGTAGVVSGQDSPAAKATRKKLKKKLSVEWKEIRVKDVVDEIKREFDGRLGLKIDNVSGISNNSKVSLTAKDQPLEKILGTLCDKYEMGYYVVSNPKDRNDGFIILRRSKYKERGYEEGKEPKEKAALTPHQDEPLPAASLEAPAARHRAARLVPPIRPRDLSLSDVGG